jgi:hypothetical protein
LIGTVSPDHVHVGAVLPIGHERNRTAVWREMRMHAGREQSHLTAGNLYDRNEKRVVQLARGLEQQHAPIRRP